jgi:hypothetical protein
VRYASAVSGYIVEALVVLAVVTFAFWPGLARRFTEWHRRP